MTPTKMCSSCKKDLPISSFGKKAGTVSGLQYSCRECYNKSRRDYNKAHPEIVKDVLSRYYQKHKEEVLARAKKIYHRNLENNKG